MRPGDIAVHLSLELVAKAAAEDAEETLLLVPKAAWPIAALTAKIAADQVLLMPPFTATFFLSMAAMEGLSFDACVDRMKAGFWPTACRARLTRVLAVCRRCR